MKRRSLIAAAVAACLPATTAQAAPCQPFRKARRVAITTGQGPLEWRAAGPGITVLFSSAGHRYSLREFLSVEQTGQLDSGAPVQDAGAAIGRATAACAPGDLLHWPAGSFMIGPGDHAPHLGQ